MVGAITIATRTQFLTAKAVAPHMIKKRSGVIMMITAMPARMAFPFVGGFSVTCAAMEGFPRSLAAELGIQQALLQGLQADWDGSFSDHSYRGAQDRHGAGRGCELRQACGDVGVATSSVRLTMTTQMAEPSTHRRPCCEARERYSWGS